MENQTHTTSCKLGLANQKYFEAIQTSNSRLAKEFFFHFPILLLHALCYWFKVTNIPAKNIFASKKIYSYFELKCMFTIYN